MAKTNSTRIFAILLLCCLCRCSRFHCLLAFEQTLVIDLEKGGAGENLPLYSDNPSAADYPPDGFGNSLTINKGERTGGSRVRQSRGGWTTGRGGGTPPITTTTDKLPNSVHELKDLIRQLDRVFASRFEQLSKRLDRLEANQFHLRRHAALEWSAFSSDKRIRLFPTPNTWLEANKVCESYAGALVQIDSEQENRQIHEFVKNAQEIRSNSTNSMYWIGAQTMLHFNYSATIGNYSNFGGQTTEQHKNGLEDEPSIMRRCAAIFATGKNNPRGNEGRWLSRECTEKHGFVCQI